MGIYSHKAESTLPQTPLPRLSLPLQNQGFTKPTKIPYRPSKPPLLLDKGYLLRATGILEEAGCTRTCSSCTSAGGGEGADVWQLGAQPSEQAGRFAFIHHPSPLSLRHRAVEARVCCFSISRQVSVARPWAGLIFSASCPGGYLLNSASLQSPRARLLQDKTQGQRADICCAGREARLSPPIGDGAF